MPPVSRSHAGVPVAKMWSPARLWIYTALARDAKMDMLVKTACDGLDASLTLRKQAAFTQDGVAQSR